MGVHHHLAPVQFIEDRAKNRIPQPVVVIARQEADTIGLERVQRVFYFLQAVLDEGKRQQREQAEMALVIIPASQLAASIELAGHRPALQLAVQCVIA
jgi:hypothetical protein